MRHSTALVLCTWCALLGACIDYMPRHSMSEQDFVAVRNLRDTQIRQTTTNKVLVSEKFLVLSNNRCTAHRWSESGHVSTGWLQLPSSLWHMRATMKPSHLAARRRSITGKHDGVNRCLSSPSDPSSIPLLHHRSIHHPTRPHLPSHLSPSWLLRPFPRNLPPHTVPCSGHLTPIPPRTRHIHPIPPKVHLRHPPPKSFPRSLALIRKWHMFQIAQPHPLRRQAPQIRKEHIIRREPRREAQKLHS